MMLEFLERPETAAVWLWNGGVETIESYVGDAGLVGGWNLDRLSRSLSRALPPEHLAFLKGLRLSHVEGDYLFVHAGVRPGVPLAGQTPADLMWIREPFLSSDADFGYVVVHGHSIVPRPDLRPNRIAIDTGAHASGRLTCLVLEGVKTRFIHT
ncbi:MAG: serine/threonine protein phosphatase, partial [Alphaproteobacteria bacterium]|nr:serine/threonine protein phosphatase [Alphaproteobacteria bacterium]